MNDNDDHVINHIKQPILKLKFDLFGDWMGNDHSGLVLDQREKASVGTYPCKRQG